MLQPARVAFRCISRTSFKEPPYLWQMPRPRRKALGIVAFAEQALDAAGCKLARSLVSIMDAPSKPQTL